MRSSPSQPSSSVRTYADVARQPPQRKAADRDPSPPVQPIYRGIVSIDLHGVLDQLNGVEREGEAIEENVAVRQRLLTSGYSVQITSYIGHASTDRRTQAERLVESVNADLWERSVHARPLLPIRLIITDRRVGARGKAALLSRDPQVRLHVDDSPEICNEVQEYGLATIRIASRRRHVYRGQRCTVYEDLPSALSDLLRTANIAYQQSRPPLTRRRAPPGGGETPV